MRLTAASEWARARSAASAAAAAMQMEMKRALLERWSFLSQVEYDGRLPDVK